LFAYVRLPGQFPITRVDFVYKKRKRVSVGFLQRDDFDENSMKAVDALIEKHEKSRVIIDESASQANEKVVINNQKMPAPKQEPLFSL
jgi:hypothetical protein